MSRRVSLPRHLQWPIPEFDWNTDWCGGWENGGKWAWHDQETERRLRVNIREVRKQREYEMNIKGVGK